ncbi:class D sortase [Peribacillus cavernae]|uniref:Class D sortase n=1 Tax=Peribacillus cavernae TaxID=1674310 RepID=A0A433HUR3_9BACI|nr:class D sortase [Peribacillus cavernae]MDQ0220019.1 sortase A [Peribacillus cavernae]RUQ32080.1 class D sortase [Peribacillus cavernae]
MKEKQPSKKRTWLIACAVLLFCGGIYFTTTNAFTFIKGYAMYKIDKPEAAAETKPQKSLPASKPEKKEEVLYPERPKTGEMMGELYIPKLEKSLSIYHGTDENELEKGVGHYAQSVLPGERDNSVLSGHRDTVFRRLGEVGKGDLLIARTEAGTFTYKVRKVRIVDADDRTVIVPKPKATLTVTTCYPFSFIGHAPERYVLVADLLTSEMK